MLPPSDPFYHFLLTGIKDGFKITSEEYHGPNIWEHNYKSATGPQWHHIVEQQIITELENGRYIPVSARPRIVSALGAIPKKNSTQVRIIHDCSRPHGSALNDLAHRDKFSYQTFQDAVALITPKSYLAKLDLSSAYRSVKLHPSDWEVSGLAWTFSGEPEPLFMIDKRLMFGARKSPYIFHHLSQAVCRIMSSHGYPGIVCYLDDFLVISDSYQKCQETLEYLMKILRHLGFAINYSKLEGPSRVLNFLGIQLDVDHQVLRLPPQKLQQFLSEVRQIYHSSSASKKQLQSLVGKLSWACQVIHGGRPHLRRLLDSIHKLNGPRHRTRITADMKLDLAWWIAFAKIFNGSVPMLDHRNHLSVSIDACSSGAGGFSHGLLYHLDWTDWPGTEALHINYKEVLALEPAIMSWAPYWQNHVVDIYSDNQAAVSILNKGTCRDPLVMESLRRVFWLSAVYNIKLQARYYPGTHNILADACSRLPHPTACRTLVTALQHTYI